MSFLVNLESVAKFTKKTEVMIVFGNKRFVEPTNGTIVFVLTKVASYLDNNRIREELYLYFHSFQLKFRVF